LNLWAINHDPVRHPDPDTFMPERYVNDPYNAAESAALPDVKKRGNFSLGIISDLRSFHFWRWSAHL